jgi:hypothetical protein
MSRLALALSIAVPLFFVGCDAEAPSDDDDVEVTSRVTLWPPVAGRGQTLTVRLEADQSRFNFGTTELDLGEGIFVDTVNVTDGYSAEAMISVDPDADLGVRDAVVTIDGVPIRLAEAFRVTDDSILSIEPNNGKMGEVLNVALVGNNTTWESGYTWGGFGRGVDVMTFDVLSPTLATARIAIRPDARPGPRDVTVETGPDVVALYDGFTVDRAVIACEFTPGEGYQGETKDFTITCLDTDWGPGTRVEFWDDGGRNPDIGISEIQVIDGENMYGRMRLSNAAFVGPRDVFITNGRESVLLPDAFKVLESPPRLDNVAISLGFDVQRQISNENGSILEQVSAFAAFVIPLDPPCGSPPPPGSGPMPYDINGVFPVPPEATPQDCPAPQTVSAGDYVWFESDENVVTLHKDLIESTGQVIYVGRDLTLDDYRFNKMYDLHTQGDPDGIPEVILPGVQPTVPADYYITSPEIWGDFTHPRSEPFFYTWTPAQTYPDAIFITQISGTLVATGRGGFAGSVPWDDGEHTYMPAELTQLEASPVSFLAVSFIEGPYFGFPFSTIQTNQSDSQLVTAAQMILE